MTRVLRVIGQLSERDRGLYLRWSLSKDSARALRETWILITHAGGTTVSIAAVALPLWLRPWDRSVTWVAAASLAISHLAVQVIKRFVGRPRPSKPIGIDHPDRFSFPSGHATSSLAVTLAYAVAFPHFAVPLVGFGLLVGWSRVALGVHYPGDVLAGQVIASATVLGVSLIG
ncbi:MAG: phosphatase PAP2 family protein [Gemmatimonadales bacterium]